MRLEQLTIENFRGFESLTLRFHPEVTVLVGANGSGKTTVLEAVVLVLAHLLQPDDAPEHYRFSESDYRLDTPGVTLSLVLEHRGVRSTARAIRIHKREGIVGSFWGDALDRLYDKSRDSASVPIAAYYDVKRYARDSTPGSRDAIYRQPRDAWKDAWKASAGFKELFLWYREREDVENAERIENPNFRDLHLDAVRRAIESILPGYSRPRVRRPRGAKPSEISRPTFTITKGDRELAFDQLSGGERVLIALAGDIARRLAIANPESNDPLRGEGVVLIDEIDLHLHPEWQAKVIPALRRTFPNVQLVVTTHSLIVLSYVPSECVRLLEDFQVYEAPTPTEGREPNALASEIYGIPLRPPEVEAELHRIATLIDEERYDEARAAIDALSEKLGDNDTGIVRLQTALSLEDV